MFIVAQDCGRGTLHLYGMPVATGDQRLTTGVGHKSQIIIAVRSDHIAVAKHRHGVSQTNIQKHQQTISTGQSYT
jgi:hypothetical protein